MATVSARPASRMQPPAIVGQDASAGLEAHRVTAMHRRPPTAHEREADLRRLREHPSSFRPRDVVLDHPAGVATAESDASVRRPHRRTVDGRGIAGSTDAALKTELVGSVAAAEQPPRRPKKFVSPPAPALDADSAAAQRPKRQAPPVSSFNFLQHGIAEKTAAAAAPTVAAAACVPAPAARPATSGVRQFGGELGAQRRGRRHVSSPTQPRPRAMFVDPAYRVVPPWHTSE